MAFQFSSKAAKEVIQQSQSKSYLPLGIHENCELNDVQIKETPNGLKYMWFEIKQPETESFTEIKVWFPNEEKVKPRENETQEQAVSREINTALAKLVHVYESVTETELNLNANSFEEFCTNLTAKLRGKKGKVRIKLTYDSKGAYVVPADRIPFIESQSKENSQLRYSKWELENRMKKATPENDSIILNNKTEDDLPF